MYLAAKNQGLMALKSSLQAIFAKAQLDAIVYPTANRPASLIKPSDAPAGGADGAGAGRGGGESAFLFADESGSPEIIVPAGMTKDGLPVTLSFLGQPYSEPKLLGYSYDFEQATRARVLPKTTPALPGDTIPQ